MLNDLDGAGRTMKYEFTLVATGGGPGGGWGSSLGFERRSKGFSVYLCGDGEREEIRSSDQELSWRSACQLMRSYSPGWIGCEIDFCPSVQVSGLVGWRAQLLVLSSMNDETLGFGSTIDSLLEYSEEDLARLSGRSPSFFDGDYLASLRDLIDRHAESPVETWSKLGLKRSRFDLEDLVSRVEMNDEREAAEFAARRRKLELLAEDCRQDIEELLLDVVGSPPSSGIEAGRKYHHRRSALELRVLEHLQCVGRLPSRDEAAKLL